MRSKYKTEEKENFIDSDQHTPTNLSCLIFDSILQEIQVSNLNYQIQLSPFSALISLKKSFIKEKDGSLRLPIPPLSSSHRGSQLRERERERVYFSDIVYNNSLLTWCCDLYFNLFSCLCIVGIAETANLLVLAFVTVYLQP